MARTEVTGFMPCSEKGNEIGIIINCWALCALFAGRTHGSQVSLIHGKSTTPGPSNFVGVGGGGGSVGLGFFKFSYVSTTLHCKQGLVKLKKKKKLRKGENTTSK